MGRSTYKAHDSNVRYNGTTERKVHKVLLKQDMIMVMRLCAYKSNTQTIGTERRIIETLYSTSNHVQQ